MRKHMKALLLFLLLLLPACSMVEVRGKDALGIDEHLKLGAIYEGKGEYDLALREYDSASLIDGDDSRAYFAKGNVYMKKKEYSLAEENYKKAIELDPRPEYQNNLSLLYMEKGEHEKAEAMAKGAAGTDSDKGYIYLDTLGMIQMKAGKLLDAEEAFLAAANKVPHGRKEAYTEIYGHLIELYRKSGEEEKARLVEEKLELFNQAKPPGFTPGVKGGL